eukprot:501178_1
MIRKNKQRDNQKHDDIAPSIQLSCKPESPNTSFTYELNENNTIDVNECTQLNDHPDSRFSLYMKYRDEFTMNHRKKRYQFILFPIYIIFIIFSIFIILSIKKQIVQNNILYININDYFLSTKSQQKK